MLEREIDPVEWRQFGSLFSEQHRGWRTDAVRREAGGVEHQLWRDAALEQLEIEQADGVSQLVCIAHTPEESSTTRVGLTTDAPRRVVALHEDGGRHAGLRVETEDGGITEIRFRVAAAPASVDLL